MTDARRSLGIAGESAACAHLERQGYQILARNARADRVELDIVAERAGVIVFVEVKTRRTAEFGGAAETVDARKQARLARGAAAWLSAHRRRTRSVRFDVITCEADGDAPLRLTHWESAF